MKFNAAVLNAAPEFAKVFDSIGEKQKVAAKRRLASRLENIKGAMANLEREVQTLFAPEKSVEECTEAELIARIQKAIPEGSQQASQLAEAMFATGVELCGMISSTHCLLGTDEFRAGVAEIYISAVENKLTTEARTAFQKVRPEMVRHSALSFKNPIELETSMGMAHIVRILSLISGEVSADNVLELTQVLTDMPVKTKEQISSLQDLGEVINGLGLPMPALLKGEQEATAEAKVELSETEEVPAQAVEEVQAAPVITIAEPEEGSVEITVETVGKLEPLPLPLSKAEANARRMMEATQSLRRGNEKNRKRNRK